MFETLYLIVLIGLLFGGSIFVHELGHFLVAKWCGLKIKTFSIGFGKAIVSKTVNGVEYKIGWLPLGGYVALPQMDPSIAVDQPNADGEAYPAVAPWKKILVAVAGAFFNILFALILAIAVWQMGKPAQPAELSSKVGFVDQKSEAYKQGLREGDVIRAVRGKGSTTWETVENWRDVSMLSSLHTDLELEVEKSGGEKKTVTLPTKEAKVGVRYIKGLSGIDTCRIGNLTPGFSAEKAGLKRGDKILSFDGKKIFSQQHLISLVQARAGKTSKIVVEREGKEMTFKVTPEQAEIKGADGKITKRALIGIVFQRIDPKSSAKIHPEPQKQMKYFSSTIYRVLKALFTPKESKQAAAGLSGPVGIFVMFWLFAESLSLAFWFTALLNVNLAMINLLPLPILDGGHVVMAIIEWITKKPPNPRFITALANIFLIFFMTAFLWLSFRDVGRFILPKFNQPEAVSAETSVKKVNE